jgi:hypothetical protein
MPLQDSGAISMLDIKNELKKSGTITLNDTDVRELLWAGGSGTIISVGAAYGATASSSFYPLLTNYTLGSPNVAAFAWVSVPTATGAYTLKIYQGGALVETLPALTGLNPGAMVFGTNPIRFIGTTAVPRNDYIVVPSTAASYNVAETSRGDQVFILGKSLRDFTISWSGNMIYLKHTSGFTLTLGSFNETEWVKVRAGISETQVESMDLTIKSIAPGSYSYKYGSDPLTAVTGADKSIKVIGKTYPAVTYCGGSSLVANSSSLSAGVLYTAKVSVSTAGGVVTSSALNFKLV